MPRDLELRVAMDSSGAQAVLDALDAIGRLAPEVRERIIALIESGSIALQVARPEPYLSAHGPDVPMPALASAR